MATKLDQAKEIVQARENQNWAKEKIIADIEKRAGCTPGSAIAYYYRAKKVLKEPQPHKEVKVKTKVAKTKRVKKTSESSDVPKEEFKRVVPCGEFVDGDFKVVVEQISELNVNVEVYNKLTGQKASSSAAPKKKNVDAKIKDLKQRLMHA